MESETMLATRENSFYRRLRGGSNSRRCITQDSEPNTTNALNCIFFMAAATVYKKADARQQVSQERAKGCSKLKPPSWWQTFFSCSKRNLTGDGKRNCWSFVSKFYLHTGGRNSSVGSAWARCPQRRGFYPPLGTFSGIGDFSLGVNMGSNSIPPKTLSDERSSLCTHAFHRMDSKDPDVHVLDGWMPATKTHPSRTIHEDGMWLP